MNYMIYRHGLLEKIPRSREELQPHELEVAKTAFNLFDIDSVGHIQIEELKAL